MNIGLVLGLALCLMSLAAPCASAGMHASYDADRDVMLAEPSTRDALCGAPSEQLDFNADVPHHLIRAGLCQAFFKRGSLRATWPQWTAQFGYAITELVKNADRLTKSRLPEDFGGFARREMQRGRCEVAERIARWALLAPDAGVVVEPSLAPPSLENSWVDFAFWVEMKE